MQTNIGNINAYSYSQISGGNKLYVPVSKAALLYSHFDHVSGIAAKSNQNGVSISKIQILNTLIERLSAMKSQPKESVTDLSNDAAEQLIKNYQEQIRTTMAQKPYLLAGASPEAGELFSFSV